MRLTINEVAMLIGVSAKTIENWYMWKRRNPDHELAMLLPDYKQTGARQTRYWDTDDVPRIKSFKERLPRGRGGLMGEVTNRERKNEAE